MNDVPTQAWMRIVFPDPGFFLNDPRMVVQVNGWNAYVGGFRGGFDVRFPVHPGMNMVVARIETLINREKQYPIRVYEGCAVDVWLEYDRFWGNFSASPRVVQYPIAPPPGPATPPTGM